MARIGERPDIESKLSLIAQRIVRGKHAKNNKEVWFYQLNKYITLVATALTSIGLSHPLLSAYNGNSQNPTLQQIVNSFTGFPLIILVLGILGFVSLIILREVYKAENVEKKAIESLAVSESFTRLEVDFLRELENAEPLVQLEPVRQAAHVLERNAAMIFPAQQSCQQLIDDYTSSVIREKCILWNSTLPLLDQREVGNNGAGGN